MTIDSILASSVANEEQKEKKELFNKMTKEEQVAYAINSMIDVIQSQQQAMGRIVHLLEDLNLQNTMLRRRVAEAEVKLDSLEERI